MKSKDLEKKAREEFGTKFLAAIQTGDEKAVAAAIAEYSEQLQDVLMQYRRIGDTDSAVLAARGVRVLTSQEVRYYTAIADAMKEQNSQNIKLAIQNIDVAMPETIIDAVMEDIESKFPLLEEIDFRNTPAITKWFYNKQGVQEAKWDIIGAEISKELQGDIGSMDLTMAKLTAYMIISKDFLALGPVWLDRYMRAILSEANGLALEKAIVDGDGQKCPIGMTRDLTSGTTDTGVTTYKRKKATKVKMLDPKTYGAILQKLTKTPTGRKRTIKDVIMVVNPSDYMLKVMPATTILTPQGVYVSDVLPFPTKIIQSEGMPEGYASVGIAKRYFMGMGTSKKGFIDYDDHQQFLEDNRIYATHLHGNGMPLDNNAFELLDITELEAPVCMVQLQQAADAATTTEDTTGK